MKICFKKILGVSLLTLVSNAYAINTICPPTGDVRTHGQFVDAFQVGEDRWLLTPAEGFSYQNDIWYLQYYVTLPHVHDSETARDMGQDSFNRSYLLKEPSHTVIRSSMSCQYSIPGSENLVRVVSYFKPF